MALNYPVGETIHQGLELEKLQPQQFLSQFFEPGFSGYVVVTIEGFSGIEEGILFFQGSLGVGAAFSYDNHDIAVFGDEALESFFNALAAKKGVVDVFRLSKQQIDLILALDERTAVKIALTKQMLSKKIRTVYDVAFARIALKGLERVIKPSTSLLKKIGLGELSR